MFYKKNKKRFFAYLILMLIGSISSADCSYTEEPQPTFRETNIVLEQNTAEVIKLTKDTGEVFVANPDVADVQLNSPEVAYVFAKKPGVTTIFASNSKGELMRKIKVTVVFNVGDLKNVIKSIAPDESIKVYSTPAGMVLDGTVSSPKVAGNIAEIAGRFVDEKQTVVNQLKVRQPTQVYLKVKIAEVNRTVLSQLGINWNSTVNSASGRFAFGVLQGAHNPLGAGTSLATTFAQSTASDALARVSPAGIGFRNLTDRVDITGLFDALDSEGLASILAEPNLIALSGETASFLVGGEFPYPVPQENNTTIEFKQFGISLAFTPTLLNENHINLRVRPEVSSLDYSNVVSLSGIAVPSIRTRRAETSVELGAGQSLAIAGLFSSEIANSMDNIPWISDIPILGALFSSTKFRRNQTELVIIVTPYTVNPVDSPEMNTPIQGLQHASHIDMVLSNKLNRGKGGFFDFDQRGDIGLIGNAGFHVQ
jgi:pilus assembly protein CpaC